jgi:hypothetical protein
LKFCYCELRLGLVGGMEWSMEEGMRASMEGMYGRRRYGEDEGGMRAFVIRKLVTVTDKKFVEPVTCLLRRGNCIYASLLRY